MIPTIKSLAFLASQTLAAVREIATRPKWKLTDELWASCRRSGVRRVTDRDAELPCDALCHNSGFCCCHEPDEDFEPDTADELAEETERLGLYDGDPIRIEPVPDERAQRILDDPAGYFTEAVSRARAEVEQEVAAETVGPARDEEALDLLRTDPAAYFRKTPRPMPDFAYLHRSGGQTYETPPRPRISTPGPRVTDSDRLDRIAALLEDIRNLLQHNTCPALAVAVEDSPSLSVPLGGASESQNTGAGQPTSLTRTELTDALYAVDQLIKASSWIKRPSYWHKLGDRLAEATKAAPE